MSKTTNLRLTAEHILYGISIANALRLAWAYATADAQGNVFSVPGAFGSLLGLSISLGTAFVAGKLGGKMTQTRKAITWTVLVSLLILEPIILAPITMTHMSVSMVTLLGPIAGWVWAAILALVPSLVLAGVAVANGGLIEATAAKTQNETSESLSVAAGGSAKKKARSKSQSGSHADVACRYAPQCGRTFYTQNAANAHARNCGYKPIAVMPVDGPKVENK